jgi:hypothetical protein
MPGSEALAAFAFHFRRAPRPSGTAVQTVTDVAAQLFERVSALAESGNQALAALKANVREWR